MARSNGFVFVFCWLALIIFFPTFAGGLTLHSGQKILYLLCPLLSLSFLFISFICCRCLYLDITGWSLVLLFFLFLFSSISKTAFIDVRLLLAHFRYVAYFILYVGVYNYVVRCHLTEYQLIRALVLLTLAVLLFVVVQLIVPSIVEPLGISNRNGVGRLGFRIGGPLVWSYGLAFVLVPVYAYTFLSIYVKMKFAYCLLLSMLLLTILGGQSKAAYLSIVLCTGLLLILGFRLVSRVRALVICVICILSFFAVCVFVAANLEAFGNIARFTETLGGNEVDASTQTRMDQLSHLKYTLDNNLWLGFPRHYIVIENAYGYYLYNYGVLGLLAYISVMVVVFLRCWKLFFAFRKVCGVALITKLAAAALCFALSAFIFSLANSPLDGHKTAYFYWSFFAVYFALCRNSVRKLEGRQ